MWTAAQWLKESAKRVKANVASLQKHIRLMVHHSCVMFVWLKSWLMSFHCMIMTLCTTHRVTARLQTPHWCSPVNKAYQAVSIVGIAAEGRAFRFWKRGDPFRWLRKASNLEKNGMSNDSSNDVNNVKPSVSLSTKVFHKVSLSLRKVPKYCTQCYFANRSCINSCIAWSISIKLSTSEEENPMLEIFDQHCIALE